MAGFLEKIYEKAPSFFKELMVTGYNLKRNKIKYGKRYLYYKKKYRQLEFASQEDLLKQQNELFLDFFNYTIQNSKFYATFYKNYLGQIKSIDDLRKLPIIDKETLRQNIETIYTIDKSKASIGRTGGTTGKPLTLFYTSEDLQARQAMLDIFRERFGYRTRAKTAWFSGKNIITASDIKKNVFWKTDVVRNIRYYSTFHMSYKNLIHYLNDLNKFKPEFVVGFPSSLYELARFAEIENYKLEFNSRAIFPTAETLIENEITSIENLFNCGAYNQYASSDGAPFLLECEKKNLHYELLSGIFEVVDDKMNPSNEGEILVTSFTTHGTPLIRYRIGDRIRLKDGICSCGRNTPLVEEIIGRINDYVYSKERGKINLGNISNSLKYVKGIVRFQVEQNELDRIIVRIIKDERIYTQEDEKMFMNELRYRLGSKMKIEFEYINNLEKEESGKFRLVKNNIQHLIDK